MRIASCLFCALALLASTTVPAQGRIKWRYSAPAAYFSNRPALAPDGTVYAIDVGGTLHAVASDGTPRWRLSGFGRRNVDVDANGIVYTGDETQITAVRPDGTVLWNHRVAPVAHDFLGPTVGPDGNVYAVAASGEGILSLTPGGSVRWSTPFQAGRPWVTSQELVFRRGPNGRDWFMVFSGFGHLAEVDIKDGKYTDLSSGGDYQPAVGTNQDVYSTTSAELRAFRQDGSLRWSFRGIGLYSLSDPSAAPNGPVYVVKLGRLHRLDPANGQSLWEHYDFSSLRFPIANPTNTMVLVSGRTPGYTDFLRALSPTGDLMWQIDLPKQGNFNVFPTTPVRFTPDGNTAYLGTMLDNATCYLYAFDTSPNDIADVWTWGEACQGASTKYPVLGFTGLPVLGSSFSVDLHDARPSAGGVYILGLQSIHISFEWNGAPGCTAYVRPDAMVPVQCDASGRTSVPLVVPAVLDLAGIKVFHQFVTADPVNRLGAVSTVGGASLLGF